MAFVYCVREWKVSNSNSHLCTTLGRTGEHLVTMPSTQTSCTRAQSRQPNGESAIP